MPPSPLRLQDGGVEEWQGLAHHWDQRYRREGVSWEPSPLLVENAHLLPPKGRALDVAMGPGRHALFLAARGLQVIGIDISRVALKLGLREARARSLPLDVVWADATALPFSREAFDVILNFYFLERAICPHLEEVLRPGGLLFFETFTMAQLPLGWGPRNPRHLLHPGELPRLFPRLEPLLYREALDTHGPHPKAIASLIARRPC